MNPGKLRKPLGPNPGSTHKAPASPVSAPTPGHHRRLPRPKACSRPETPSRVRPRTQLQLSQASLLHPRAHSLLGIAPSPASTHTPPRHRARTDQSQGKARNLLLLHRRARSPLGIAPSRVGTPTTPSRAPKLHRPANNLRGSAPRPRKHHKLRLQRSHRGSAPSPLLTHKPRRRTRSRRATDPSNRATRKPRPRKPRVRAQISLPQRRRR